MDVQVVDVLKQIKADHGDTIFLNRNRFNALLKDYTKGQYKGEIRLLATALDEGLYRDLLDNAADYPQIRVRYMLKFKTEYFWTDEQAAFAIEAWAVIADIEVVFSSSYSTERLQVMNKADEQNTAFNRVQLASSQAEKSISNVLPAVKGKKLNKKALVAMIAIFLLVLPAVVYGFGILNKTRPASQITDNKSSTRIYGKLSLNNGDNYEGEIKDGKANGQGTFTSPNGGKYVREFKDDQMNGQGTYTLPNGAK